MGGGRKKQVKIKAGRGGGVGNERKKRVRPNFRAAGRRIWWRVPELTPNTPGPAASADCIGFGGLLCFGIIVLVFGRCFVFWGFGRLKS